MIPASLRTPGEVFPLPALDFDKKYAVARRLEILWQITQKGLSLENAEKLATRADIQMLYRDYTKDKTQRFIKDLSIVLTRCPLRKSELGRSSGVFFVDCSSKPEKSFVVKDARAEERTSHQVYVDALQVLKDPHLAIPEMRCMQNHLSAFAKVPGAPLSHFATSAYETLKPEQKKELFFSIGKLAMLDLALAGTDRLADSFEEDQGFFSNLGNLMIHVNDNESITVFLIDNAIEIGKRKMKLVSEMLKNQIFPVSPTIRQIQVALPGSSLFCTEIAFHSETIQAGFAEMAQNLLKAKDELSKRFDSVILRHRDPCGEPSTFQGYLKGIFS